MCGPAGTPRWRDEAHGTANRAYCRRNFALAERILGNRFGFRKPAGGFFLWLDVGDGEAAALKLWREAGVRVLPGDQSAFAVKIASRGVEEQRVASWQVESILRGKVDALDRLEGGILGTCVHHGVNGRGIVRRARDVLQPDRTRTSTRL